MLLDVICFLDSVKENLLDFEDCPKLHIENTENPEHHLEKHKENENSIIWVRTLFSRTHIAHTDYIGPDIKHRTTWLQLRLMGFLHRR